MASAEQIRRAIQAEAAPVKGEWTGVVKKTKPDGVLEDVQILVREPVVLRVDVLGDETEEALLGGRDAVAAAHGEPKHEGLVLDHHAPAEEDVNVVVCLEDGRAVKNDDARQVELGVLDKLDDQRHVVLVEAKFVQLSVSLLEGQIRGGQGDKPVFNFFFDRHKPEVCGRKIDFHHGNEKKMAAGAKKNEAPPDSRASQVQGMEANRTPSQFFEQTAAGGAPNAVFVPQYQ